MKLSPLSFFGLLLTLSGCSTTPAENDQQAFESTLTEGQSFMATLHTLDSGDITKTRRVAFTPVCVDLSTLPYFASKGHPTPDQMQDMRLLAKEALDYMVRHKAEFNPRLVSGALRGLHKILTGPDDVKRLEELSEYFAEREKQMTNAQKP